MKSLIVQTGPEQTITTMIHDIASPMTSIRLNLDLIEFRLGSLKKTDAYTIDLIKYIHRAISGVDKVKDIINTSLDDRYSSRSMEFFSVKRELMNIARIFELRLASERVKLKVMVINDLKLHGLRQAFQRVMSNLITNSLEAFKEKNIYTLDQQFSFTTSLRKKIMPLQTIKILAFKSGTHYVISVEDNAGGIPLQIQKKLFKEQYTTKEKGKGLGLISIKLIVEKFFDGFIRCYSIKNKGTIFAIALPLSVAITKAI